jgi:serine phosphatase RsbU (regulator of sigma subunit)
MFELERVKNVLLQTAEWQQDEESASYVRKMTDEVAAFVGDAPQADDLTMLVIRWKG